MPPWVGVFSDAQNLACPKPPHWVSATRLTKQDELKAVFLLWVDTMGLQ